MTREEKAIMYFKDMRKKFCEDYLIGIPKDSVAYKATMAEKEFYDTAIKALEQEPCEDCISRTELLKAINTWDKFGCDADTKLVPYKDHYIPYIHYDDVIKCIKGMPSANPQEPTDENLHREREQSYMQGYEDACKKYRQEPCEDAISRQAVLDEINRIGVKGFETYNDYSQLYDFVDTLSPVKPQPCEDAISREAALEKMANYVASGYADSAEDFEEYSRIICQLPPVKPQESSITWVTGADGAKIAFWDVPVWKITKICEILGEPQESEEQHKGERSN